MKKELKIAVVGCGRFGRLWVRILSDFGEILVLDKRDDIEIDNKKMRRIDHSGLAEADWIFFAVPISGLEEAVAEARSFVAEGSLVADVCSVKSYPLRVLNEYFSDRAEILGTHPMFGPDSAKNGLRGLQIILCPGNVSDPSLDRLRRIFRELELEEIITDPEDHDRQAAVSLAFVHFLGRGLDEIDLKSQKITTLGFERLLAVNETVTADTWQLFLDMNKYNPYADKLRKDIIKALRRLDNELNK